MDETPKGLEEELAELLREQASRAPVGLDFSADAALLRAWPPKVIREHLLYLRDPAKLAPTYDLHGFHAAYYEHASVVEGLFPQQRIVRGTPRAVASFLASDQREIILDFEALGTVHLSRSPISPDPTPGAHQHLLPAWLNYALSPELWGSYGKWPRFHERLHTLFETNQLLNGQDSPGFYPLKALARDWQALGITGSLNAETLELTLPWTFSLTDLTQLEGLLNEDT
jgi:hypothetical protein